MIAKFFPPRRAKDAEHAVVYRRENEFASHPYIRGFWETAAGHLISIFSVASVDYAGDPRRLSHYELVHVPGGRRAVTVRSEDRGRTWTIWNEDRNRPINDVMAPRPGIDGQAGRLIEIGPIDYTNKDVLVSNFNYLFMRDDPLLRDFLPTVSTAFGPPENQVFIRVSKDAGSSWSRTVILPKHGIHALSAIQSSLVRPDGRCLLFLTGVTEEGGPLRPLVYRSIDDGTSFHFMSYITPRDDPFFSGLKQWYPRGIMLPSGRILCVMRMERDALSGDMWTEMYSSDDGGRTWQFLSRPTEFGAPAHPLLLSDGRVALVYTYRLPDFGIRAIVSEDGGSTWGPEIIVRDDGGSWDLGYPIAWELEPGRIGTIYYFNDRDDPIQVKSNSTLWGIGGVRYIARSFFSVD